MVEIILGFILPGRPWQSWVYARVVKVPRTLYGVVVRVLGFHVGIRVGRVQ